MKMVQYLSSKYFFGRKIFTETKEIPTISWACPKKIGFRNYGQIHHVIFLLAKVIPKICSQVFSLRNIVTWYYFCIFSPYFAIVFMKSILVLYMLRRISPRFDFVLHSYSFANVVPMPLTVFVLWPKKNMGSVILRLFFRNKVPRTRTLNFDLPSGFMNSYPHLAPGVFYVFCDH